jgi:hypothetical protein
MWQKRENTIKRLAGVFRMEADAAILKPYLISHVPSCPCSLRHIVLIVIELRHSLPGSIYFNYFCQPFLYPAALEGEQQE